LSSWLVGMLGDKALVQGFLIIRVETAPESGVALPFGNSARLDKNLGKVVELVVVVDDVGLVIHASLSVLVGKFCQLLP